MSEIRDFLTEMVIPDIQSADFVQDFNEFCIAIRDNINKIVSAPFLKGDKGSDMVVKIEPLMYKDSHGYKKWTDFAKNLIRSIYDSSEEIPLPLIYNEGEDDTLLDIDDPEIEQMIEIDGGPIEVDQDIYYSYDIFKELMQFENEDAQFSGGIPICYAEESGEISPAGDKIFWVPFYFFDGRLNYVKYFEEDLSTFVDESCTIWGKASYTAEEITEEDLNNPNNWNWNLIKRDALPKLYYNSEVGQFCWAIEGEKTNIIAQGIKGDKGNNAQSWICAGNLIDSENNPRLVINTVLSPISPEDSSEILVQDIQEGDLAFVLYKESDEQEYFQVQMGIVFSTGDEKYINSNSDYELIQWMRNISLYDYMAAIGRDDDFATEALPTPSALFTRERDNENDVMAMWAGNNNNHYIVPTDLSKMTNTNNTENNPKSGKTLKILYDTVVFKNKIKLDSIESSKGLDIISLSTLADSSSITSDYFQEYRLSVLCNVLSTQKDSRIKSCRIGDYSVIGSSPLNENVLTQSAAATYKSSANYIFIECELIMGWVPKEEADNFNGYLISNSNNSGLDIYRAQKYHIYARIPVINSNGVAAISYDGRSWSNTLFFNGNLSYKGAKTTFTVSIDPNIKFEEYAESFAIASNLPSGITRELIDDNDHYNYFYRYLSVDGNYKTKGVQYIEYEQIRHRYNKVFTEQYVLSPNTSNLFSLSTHIGNVTYTVSDLFWFGTNNEASDNYNGLPFKFPLIDDKFSFLSYPTNSNNGYIITNNRPGNYMWQGRVLSSNPVGYSSSAYKQDLYHINTSFFETLNSNPFIMLTPLEKASRRTGDDRMHSIIPIGSLVRVYPEGMNGLAYQRVPVTNSIWDAETVEASDLSREPIVAPTGNIIN